MSFKRRSIRWPGVILLAFVCLTTARNAPAQTGDVDDDDTETRCHVLCAPELKIEPTFTFENVFSRARLEVLDSGNVVDTVEQERDHVFELILAVDIPTELPRVGFTVETIFLPLEDDNEVEFEFELNLSWLEAEQTGGWVSSHFDIVDKFSPSKRPSDTSAYTHKLDFELDTAVLVFNWLDEGSWLRHIELEASLDYLATGLPQAQDVIDGVRFLDDASPWSFSLVIVAPLAPLFP
jgi:hypothetical protein